MTPYDEAKFEEVRHYIARCRTAEDTAREEAEQHAADAEFCERWLIEHEYSDQ